MLDDYQQRRHTLADLHQRVQAITGTATSPRREVTATVTHTGAVVDISFSGPGYRRLPPRELSDLVLQTIVAAREKAVAEAATLMAPVLPQGIDARQLLAGRLGFEDHAPSAGPRMSGIVRDQLER
ncbi:hypothetical protein BG844_23300 [Couchioplanes caeruleus subsp. caeruleus]|uniref:YbaB/EbfC DNA-binding family protein n=2 Tax=Couchioplanes caeruleus TaxID=56438 RepID=A0A1K0FGJ8_9ACTN|nr:hypothetical protein BG844_23300 [Couchioplanes caeruleus subsp. caeruleus]